MGKRATFRQSDLTRALKAAKQADVRVVVEIMPDGTLRVAPAPSEAESRPLNPVEARRARRGEA